MLQNPRFSWSHPIFLDFNAVWSRLPSVYGGELSALLLSLGILGRPFLALSLFFFQVWNAAPFPRCPPRHFWVQSTLWNGSKVVFYAARPQFPLTCANLLFFPQTVPITCGFDLLSPPLPNSLAANPHSYAPVTIFVALWPCLGGRLGVRSEFVTIPGSWTL